MGNEVTIPESKEATDVEQTTDYRSTMRPSKEIQPILNGIKAKINRYSNGTVTIVSHGIVQLFKSKPAHGGKDARWKNVRITGLAVLLLDRKIGGVPIIRIYDIGPKYKLRFEHEVYQGMDYNPATPQFHTFEVKNAVFGVCFHDKGHAEQFLNKVRTYTPKKPKAAKKRSSAKVKHKSLVKKYISSSSSVISVMTEAQEIIGRSEVLPGTHRRKLSSLGLDFDSGPSAGNIPNEVKRFFNKFGVSKADIKTNPSMLEAAMIAYKNGEMDQLYAEAESKLSIQALTISQTPEWVPPPPVIGRPDFAAVVETKQAWSANDLLVKRPPRKQAPTLSQYQGCPPVPAPVLLPTPASLRTSLPPSAIPTLAPRSALTNTITNINTTTTNNNINTTTNNNNINTTTTIADSSSLALSLSPDTALAANTALPSPHPSTTPKSTAVPPSSPAPSLPPSSLPSLPPSSPAPSLPPSSTPVPASPAPPPVSVSEPPPSSPAPAPPSTAVSPLPPLEDVISPTQSITLTSKSLSLVDQIIEVQSRGVNETDAESVADDWSTDSDGNA